MAHSVKICNGIIAGACRLTPYSGPLLKVVKNPRNLAFQFIWVNVDGVLYFVVKEGKHATRAPGTVCHWHTECFVTM